MRTIADMASLPWPGDAQLDAFVAHVCSAHSWYKHLPFDETARFVVFLAADVAAGIDYAWLLPHDDDDDDENDGWRRDGDGAAAEPSPELLAIAGFHLGPTCSDDDNAIDTICMLWPEEATFDSAEARAPFERLTALHRRWEEAYRTLADDERLAVAGLRLGHAPTAEDEAALARPRVVDYRAHDRRLDDHYESMRAPQVARIRDAIARLRDALAAVRGDPSVQ